jgi:hypothetical protein
MKYQAPDKREEIEGRIRELQRRTLSNLTVTDPDADTIFRVEDGLVTVTGTDGNFILWTTRPPQWGFANPWANYVMYPSQPIGAADAAYVNGVWVSNGNARIRPQHARLKVTTATRAIATAGARVELKASYTVNGGPTVDILESMHSTLNTAGATITNSWEYVWPVDYWDDVITLSFRSRYVGTVAGGDATYHGPTRFYGAAL